MFVYVSTISNSVNVKSQSRYRVKELPRDLFSFDMDLLYIDICT